MSLRSRYEVIRPYFLIGCMAVSCLCVGYTVGVQTTLAALRSPEPLHHALVANPRYGCDAQRRYGTSDAFTGYCEPARLLDGDVELRRTAAARLEPVGWHWETRAVPCDPRVLAMDDGAGCSVTTGVPNK